MSDLIERYGYERAVRELKAMDDRAIWMISSCLKYREEVRKECLEYRRANNIYEVGDKVVLKRPDQFSEIYTYDAYIERLDLHFFESEHDYGHVALDRVRHATDAEIKAGHRL